MKQFKALQKLRRICRTRAKIHGTAERPRFCVSKSNKHIYCQLIDDEIGETIASVSDREIKYDNKKSEIRNPEAEPSVRNGAGPKSETPVVETSGFTTGQANSNDRNSKSKTKIKNAKSEGRKEFLSKKILIAKEMGKLIAKKAIEKGIKKLVFDRRGCKYHGIIKAVAEGAREEGLQF